MKRGLWNKRIPNLFAFVLLFASIWVTSYLIQTGVIFIGQASPDKTPKNIKIGNVNDSSFAVAFTTEGKTRSGLSIEEVGKNPYLVYDNTESYSHLINVVNLSPNTSYNFTILVNGEEYKNGNQKYFIRTGNALGQSKEAQSAINGQALLPDGTQASDTIYTIEINGGQLIIGKTSSDGTFKIQTDSIRKKDLSDHLKIKPEDSVVVTLSRQNFSSTTNTIFKNANDLVLILAKDYTFTSISETDFSTKSSELKSFATKGPSGNIKILTPRTNEAFVDSRPLFRGTALPNQKVKIKIESEIIIDEVTADRNGVWTYRPQQAIAAGQHKLTIETPDSFGVSKLLTESFTVYASGSQIAEPATPSATPRVSPTSTPKPTVTAAPTSPTLSPIPSLSPTIAITITPTSTLTPTPTIALATSTPTQAPVVTPPAPGNSSSLVLTVISILLIFAGSTLLFVL